MKKIFILLTFILSFSTHASLLLEPWAGGNLSKFDYGDNRENGGGYALGGRLGFQGAGLQAGLDLAFINTDLDKDFYSEDFRQYHLSPFIGYRFPILLKVYGGVTAARAKTKISSNSHELEAKKGWGYLLGAGFTLLPLLDLNLEYREGTYGQVMDNGTEVDSSAQYRNILATLSIPFTLF